MSATAARLLSELRRRGVEVKVDGDRLLYRPKVEPELRERIARCKPDLLALLRSDLTAPEVASSNPDSTERAAHDCDRSVPCRCCGSRDFWALAHVHYWVCAGCHEPDPRPDGELIWVRVGAAMSDERAA